MFWIFYILRLAQSSCSYTNFDQFQLNSASFYQEKQYVRGNPYAFGVWTQQAPLRKNFYGNKSKPYFDSTRSLDGFHILNFQSGGSIQTLFYQQPVYVTGYPILSGVLSYKIQQGLFYYEGYWVFTYFSFSYNNKYNFASYNTGDNRFYNFLITDRRLTVQTTNVKLEHGGQGLYVIGTSSYNLNLFSGRISIITTFESSITFFLNTDKVKFQQFISNCYVPPACQKPVELYFFNETYNQNNFTVANYYVDIPGLIYKLEFWMKRDSYKISSQKEILISFGGSFSTLDRFYQLVLFWKAVDQDVGLLHQLDFYELVPGEKITDNSFSDETYFLKPSKNFEKWSYFKYQFWKFGQSQIIQLSLYQSCCDTWQVVDLFDIPNSQQYSNYQAIITIFTQQKDVTVLPFEGLISNLRFTYCYNLEYVFGQQSNQNCNALCKTCTGPTQYDCASCFDEQNRYLQTDLHQCYCKSNYEEASGLICQKTFLSSISEQKELYKEFSIIEVQNKYKCSYGYFEVWKELEFLGCIICPYFGQGHNSVNCINCILNSHNWYLNPICNIDYRTDDSKFYYNQQLDYQSQEIFIINFDLMVTEQCPGCEYLTKTKNSQSIIKNVNGLNTYYKCKQYLYPKDNSCKQCEMNCINCKDAENCIECNQGFYIKNDHCYQCPQGCLSCILDAELEQLKCLHCQQGYSLENDNCQKCGDLCQICQKKLNKNTGKEYMKCLKCNYNAYISLDGESCYFNNLDHCIYPFQFSVMSNQINTIYYDFQPQESQHIKTGCTFCSAVSLLDTGNNLYTCTPLDFYSIETGCQQSLVISGLRICALGINNLMLIGVGYCTHLIPNCLFCYQNNWESSYICFKCEDGYYTDYYTSFCKPCNPECATCIQVDSSKIVKSAILIFFLTITNEKQLYYQVTQNPNKNEIELICTKCSDGYFKHFDKCIQKCPDNCKECKIINDQQVCISCIQFNDSHYNVYNGRCIQCPQNCNICHLRNDDEKLMINPYFNNKDLEYFSHKCIAPQSSDLYYDQDIQQFIKCDDINECQKEIIIDIHIYCNQIDLDNYLNQLNDKQKVIQRKFHILLENLDLSLYEYYDYFLYLNQNFVKIVTYQLTIADNQLCSLKKELKIQSNLQTNIFNLIELNLILNGSGNTLQLNNHLSLSNFTHIRIQNFNLQIQTGFISMNNIISYTVQFETIKIYQDQTSISSQECLFQIRESSEITISKLQILNINVHFLNGLFVINNQNINTKLIALDININHVKIMNTSIINYNTSQKVETKISNLHILNSQFINTTLMEQIYQTEIMEMDNFIFENSILLNAQSFLNFEQIQNVELNRFQLLESILQNSNFISSSKILLLTEFDLQKLSFVGQSTFLINQNQVILELIQINHGKIIDNIYSNKYAFILLLNSEAVYLNNIEFINNAINTDIQKDSLFKNIELSLINIQSNTVIFDTLMIQRGIGYSEFTIKNTNTFKLMNTVITLHQKYQFQSLFNNQECNLEPFNQFMYNNLVNLQNSSFIYVSNTNITDIILYNSVLFEIQMLSQISSSYFFINCNISSNILHQVNKYEKVSLISINSNYYLNLNITGVTFSSNLLNLLKESNPQKQSLILLVEAYQAKSTISQCLIQKNMILNGQGSLMYIDADLINLEDTKYFQNSAFVYDTLKQFLRWGLAEEIFLEHLQKLYISSSSGGNGNFQARSVILNKILLYDSHSIQGAAFVLKMIEDGYIQIKNSHFENLQAELIESSLGGAFHIQSQSLYLRIDVISTIFLDISSRTGGSIFYIIPSTKQFKISLLNSTFENIFSIQGGLIYIEKSIHQQQVIQMNKCSLTQNLDTFYAFINSLQEVSNNELATLTQQYSLIHCYDCQFQIRDLQVTNYPPTSLFQLYGSANLKNISIQNIIFSNQLIQFSPVGQSDQIIFHNIEFYNCTQLQINEMDIPSKRNANLLNSSLNTTCNENLIDAPSSIMSFNESFSNINQIALLQTLLSQILSSTVAMILFQFTDSYQQQKIKISDITLQNNECTKCSNGLLKFENSKKISIIISQMIISNSYCGKNGCISFISQDKRILQSQVSNGSIANCAIRIEDLQCINNQAQYGGCLFIQNQIISIIKSMIAGNTAVYGGAIFTKGINSTLISDNVVITNNSAQFGSGIYSQDNLNRNVKGIELIDNSGQNQIDEQPQQLYLQIFKDQIIKPTIVQNSQYDQKSQIIGKDGQNSIIHIPTGIPLSEYKKFEIEKNKYNYQTMQMRIYAVNSQLEIVRNLTNTYCELQINNLNSSQQQNLSLNKNKIYFNQSTFSYNLDDLIFYIPSDSNQTFEFTIKCNSIYIPIINNKNHLIEGYHQNYVLSLLIKPNDCQMGEYSQSKEDYCHQCIVDQKQYSVIVGATSCQIVDDQKIQEITQAQIFLKKGFWRRKVTTSTIDLCLNNQLNCIGGWGFGNELCQQGYLGALCEQCDYYNERGGGNYQRESFFQCQICQNDSLQQLFNLLITILMQKILLIQDFYVYLQQLIIYPKKGFNLFTYIFNKEALEGQSIKIILFYFQIISFTQELSPVFSDQIQQLIHFLGDPFSLLGIYKECQLINLEFSVIYLQILQNFIFLLILMTIFVCLILAKTFMSKQKNLKMELFNFIYLIYIFVVGSFLRSMIQLIAFRDIQDVYWIYKNISYDYTNTNHLRLVLFLFLPIVICLGIVLPFLLLQKSKSTLFLSKPIPYKNFGFWFTSYSKDHKHWEFYKFLLVNGLICLIIMIDANATIKGALSYFLLIIYTKVCQDNNIYYQKQMNRFESQLNIISIIILISCTLFSIQENQGSIFKNIILIFINSIFILSGVFMILHLWKLNSFYLRKMFCKGFERLGKFNKIFIKYNIFQAHSNSSIQLRNQRFELLKAFLKQQSKTSLSIKKEQQSSQEQNQTQGI
ncbi:unnamed protein product (macronuclear) [Paramecium tetraurelia]|uniref:Transmembrane protein n=1 Tax=Paramecium tetraurelia TaxID=5888 RepID=A0BU14_PARTE|nr:uncharacterized protein GSPATT00032263001 [Paramecium tetraurelia]CAK62031.1 unnamed protein product [Paramecium tetraurelia]|eukprot:XP_001429429.1 hypothetical protein (macronuclear) [Paramecium tetraurelia strain d4-2]